MLGDLTQPSPWRHAGAALQTASRSVAREIAFLPNIPPAGTELWQELGREFGDAAVLGCSHLAPALPPVAVSCRILHPSVPCRCPGTAALQANVAASWEKKKKKAQKKKEKNPNPAIPQSGLPAGCVCGAGWDCRWWEPIF